MTIAAVVPRARYVGAGTTGPFGFGWRVDNKNQIKVIKVNIATGAETVLTVDANYTVTGIGVALGGSITLAVALGNGTESLVIVANMPLDQGLTLSDHDDFPAVTVEQRLDWMMRIHQRHADLLNRSLLLYETDIWGQGEFNAGANRISNLADPVNAQDAITKYYHDNTYLPVMQGYVADAEAAADDAADSASTAATVMASATAAAAAATAAAALAASLAPNVGTSFTKVRSDPYLTLLNQDVTGATDASRPWLSGRLFSYGVAPTGGYVGGGNMANLLQVNDQVDNGNLPGIFSAFTVLHRIGGGNAKGSKHTIEANLGVTATIAGDNITGYMAAVAMQASAYASANMGGTGGASPSAWKGGLFGGNDHPRLSNLATFWGGITGREINVEIEAGASAWTKVGLWIVKGSNDANRGYALDVALAIVDNAVNGTPWKNGLLFGGPSGVWPFQSSDSILIGAQRRIYPSDIGARTMAAQYGVDFRDIVFSTAAFASNNFEVNDAAQVTMRKLLIPNHTVAVPTVPFQVTQTWDDGGANLSMLGFFMNIIDTASGPGSLLFSLQKGGVNQMLMNKFGEFRVLVNFAVGVTNPAVFWPEAAYHTSLRAGTNAVKFSTHYTWGSAADYQRLALNNGADYGEIAMETAGAGANDLDLRLTPAGTGLVRFGVRTALGAETVTGYITIKDAGGTSRKIAVVS